MTFTPHPQTAVSQSPERVNAGAYIVQFLESMGVDRVYGVPGESYLPVLEALRLSGIETLTTRHESSAGFMALVDGRLTGRPGVVMVSRGPGATNASIAIHTAQQDGIPMMVLIGQVERRHLRRDGFQEIDYGQMFGSIAKWVAEVTDPDDLPRILSRAYSTAISSTPGPVVIALPEDMLELDVSDHAVLSSGHRATVSGPLSAPLTAPDPVSAQRLLEMLHQASRPLIVAGMEFSQPGARQTLLAFAEAFNIPVAVSFRRHDLFPNQHRLYAGDMSSSNTAEQRALFESSDLVIALGTRLGDLSTHGYTFPRSPTPRQPLIHVYNDAAMVGRHYNPTIGLACKAPDLLALLLNMASPSSPGLTAQRDTWASQLHQAMLKRGTLPARQFDDGVYYAKLVSTISRLADQAVSVVPDAGISAAQVYRYFTFTGQRRLYATMAGVMGFGVPGSIALAMREHDRRVVCLVGDGGFMMTGFELAVAVERGLNICFFLANNRNLGTITMHQEKHYPGGAHGTTLSGPDFTQLALAFGCPTLKLDQDGDMDRVVAEALAMTGPVLVDVRTSLQAIKP